MMRIIIVIKNMATEWTRTVWEPNNRTSSSWLEMMSICCQGLGSSGSSWSFFLLSKATTTLSQSDSKTKIGLVWWTKVDTSDVAGDLGSKVNLSVTILHFDISSKLINPWNSALKALSSGHFSKEMVLCWKKRKLNDPKLYLTLGAAILREQCWVRL